jgi:hypothetical protein
MKRYVVFAGDLPYGGWGDYLAEFDTLEEAIKKVRWPKGRPKYGFHQIIDSHKKGKAREVETG